MRSAVSTAPLRPTADLSPRGNSVVVATGAAVAATAVGGSRVVVVATARAAAVSAATAGPLLSSSSLPDRPSSSVVDVVRRSSSSVVDVVRRSSSRGTCGKAETVLFQPVLTGTGDVAVVRARVPDAELDRGVGSAWAALAAVAAGLVAAARRRGHGEIDVRADQGGPPEIADVAQALNFLADRIEALLAAERERVADLSHRLRTPLTALRLEAEAADLPALTPGSTASTRR